MNDEERLQLINELAEEQLHQDTIFLHKYHKGWIAYGHCALLLQHYFTPVELRRAVVGSTKLVCAVWHGVISIRKSPKDQVFHYSSDTPQRMTIRYPEALTREQTTCAIRKSGIRMPVQASDNPCGLFRDKQDVVSAFYSFKVACG